MTASLPLATSAAPTSPPIRPWLELDGRLSAQVTRFHRIAPSRAANSTSSVIRSWTTTSSAMVSATWIEMNAPAKFSTADRATARRGLMALVAIDVAMALAVSWKPLVKSNASAVATTT